MFHHSTDLPYGRLRVGNFSLGSGGSGGVGGGVVGGGGGGGNGGACPNGEKDWLIVGGNIANGECISSFVCSAPPEPGATGSNVRRGILNGHLRL